jgi:DNA-directed RNA polymerase specialized sigma24 family protein
MNQRNPIVPSPRISFSPDSPVRKQHDDAEDAFQATFLVFVRKEASIYPLEKFGNWLYGVAHQTALGAKRARFRRETREKPMVELPEPAMTEQSLPTGLDQVLSRLPEKYRTVIVLCADQRKKWPISSVCPKEP